MVLVNAMRSLSEALPAHRFGVGGRGGLPCRRSCLLHAFLRTGTLALVVSFATFAPGATPSGSPAASAASIRGANAEVNGAPLASGTTLFPGDVVRLGAGSTVALQLGDSLVIAAPLTELVVEPGGVSLRNGRLQVRASGAESLAVSGPFFHVNVASLGGAPGSAEIRLGGNHARVSGVAGVADLTAAGNANAYRLHAGQTAMLDATGGDAAAAQGGVNQPAGQISRLFPQVTIDRSSQQLLAAASDPVLWNDDLHTNRSGRAHITLNDGSQLHLGSDTSLRILMHDAQAQQTSLDLLIGRLRGVVAKVTRPGGKFEIRTPVGVAGLVGTDFSLEVTDSYVELMVFEGAVRMNLFSNGQSVTVLAGMMVRFPLTGAFNGPSRVKPQEIELAKDLTDIPQTPTGAPPVAAGRRHIVPVLVVLSSGATAAGIAVWLDMRERKPVSPSSPSGSGVVNAVN
jgi:FecR protein